MATRNIKDAKDLSTNELIYFKGHAQATFMSDGRTVEEAISNISGDSGESIDTSNLATKTELAQKQDIISDIDTIRTNAANYKGTVTGVKINGTTKNPSNGVVDLGNVITTHQDLSDYQPKLVSGTNIKTVNGESILGSGNIVISGGGSSPSSGAYVEVNHGTADTTFTLTPNTFHIWDEVASLTLTLGDATVGVANEYLFQFNSGSTATTLTLPDSLKWANNSAPTIEANMIYQISILKGLASVLEFDNAPNLIDNIATYSAGNMMSGATLTFQYPVASDLTIALSNAASGSMTISSGETSITIDWFEPIAPSVLYIDPASDSVYNYILA